MSLRLSSLHLRMALLLLAFAAVLAVGVGALSYHLGYRRTIAQNHQHISEMSAALKSTAAIGAYTNDKVLLTEVIKGLASNPKVARVEVLALPDKVLARHQRPDGATAGLERIERDLHSPFDAQEKIGRLRIDIDTPMLQAEARRLAAVDVLVTVLHVLLLAMTMFVAAARFISRPIVGMARQLENITPGTPARLPLPGHHARDEIGTLVNGANKLLHATEVAVARERELRRDVERMEAQFRQIFDATSAAIFLLDGEGRLINGNPTVLRVLGITLDRMQQLRGEDFVRTAFDDPPRVHEMIARARERRETVSADLRLRGPALRWVHCLISVQHGIDAPHAVDRGPLIEGVMYDVTERKHTEHKVRHQAEHDGLTGLANRAAAESAIDGLLSECAASGTSATVMLIDLDGFKQANDQLGHQAGDEVLRQCAARMREVVRRSSDVVGRLGGDEFIVALRRSGPDDAGTAEVAAQLLAALQREVVLADGREARVGASIGMACYPLHGTQRNALCEAADAALYAVKGSGKQAYALAMLGSAAPVAVPVPVPQLAAH